MRRLTSVSLRDALKSGYCAAGTIALTRSRPECVLPPTPHQVPGFPLGGTWPDLARNLQRGDQPTAVPLLLSWWPHVAPLDAAFGDPPISPNAFAAFLRYRFRILSARRAAFAGSPEQYWVD